MELLLFTMPNCSECSTTKDLLELKGFEYDLVNGSTPDGQKVAAKYGVSSVPTLVILEGGKMTDSARGFEEIEVVVNDL